MRKLFFAIIIIMMALVACAKDSGEEYGRQVSVAFLNVGYGDSIIVAVNDKAYLIDTGSENSAHSLLRGLSAMDVKKIDGLFLTHADSDHIGGAEVLVQEYQVDMVYFAEISEPSKKGKHQLVQLAEELKLPYTKLNANDVIEVDDEIAFNVIAPIEYNKADDNDNSLVLLIELNGIRFLFAGDMQFAGERTILSHGADIGAHVLKVGNHGNKDATSPLFAEAVSPDYAVISTSTKEDPGSANKRVLSALSAARILITESYENGVKMNVDAGGNISIKGL